MLKRAGRCVLLLAVLAAAACAGPSPAPAVTSPAATTPAPTRVPPSFLPPSPVPASPPTASPPPPAASGAQDDLLLIHDAHLHFSADSASAYAPGQAIAVLDGAGIGRALFSSTPNDGTILLYEQFPERVVPSWRPYRTRADMGSWFAAETTVADLEQALALGVYRAIGEFHVKGSDAATPVMRRVVELAVAHHLPLQAHSDPAAIEALFAHHPEVRVIWAHAGMSASVESIDDMLGRYPNLWIDLSFRPDIAYGDEIDPAWQALFVSRPDRFLYGTDTWVKDRWQHLPDLVLWARGWLDDLPAEVASKIASENFETLFPDA
jgi:hypothetical protein